MLWADFKPSHTEELNLDCSLSLLEINIYIDCYEDMLQFKELEVE
jgi:hypothetical protein